MGGKDSFILIVDDDVDFLELTRRLLERNGYKTRCCGNPERALALMAVEKPALIVSDLMMDALDSGFSFSRSLKTDPRFTDIPIIIVTAISSRRGFAFRPESDKDLEAMHISAFFEKPYDPARFLATVSNLFQSSTGEQVSDE
jgi:CheY-like chemotaxis protein